MTAARCIGGPWAGRLHEADGDRFVVAVAPDFSRDFLKYERAPTLKPAAYFVYVVETVDFFGTKVQYWVPEAWRNLGLQEHGRKLAEAFDKLIATAPTDTSCTVARADLEIVLQALHTRCPGDYYLSECESAAVTRLRREGLKYF